MKLIRLGEPGSEAPGLLLEDGTRLDVSSFVRDYDEAFFADGGLSQQRAWLKDNLAFTRELRILSDLDRRFAAPARSSVLA
jgi:hypothetical protein